MDRKDDKKLNDAAAADLQVLKWIGVYFLVGCSLVFYLHDCEREKKSQKTYLSPATWRPVLVVYWSTIIFLSYRNTCCKYCKKMMIMLNLKDRSYSQQGTILFLSLCCAAFTVHTVTKLKHILNFNVLIINFTIFYLTIVAFPLATFLVYVVQSVIYVFAMKSAFSRFLFCIGISLIQENVHQKLQTFSTALILSYSFSQTALLLQFIHYAPYKIRGADNKERVFAVKFILFRFIIFVFQSCIHGKYLEATALSIPVLFGILALSYNTEHWRYSDDDHPRINDVQGNEKRLLNVGLQSWNELVCTVDQNVSNN